MKVITEDEFYGALDDAAKSATSTVGVRELVSRYRDKMKSIELMPGHVKMPSCLLSEIISMALISGRLFGLDDAAKLVEQRCKN